jgi:hypothetical protein
MKDQTYGVGYLEGYFDARDEFLAKFDELAQALSDQASKHAEAFIHEQDPKEKAKLHGLFSAFGAASSDIWGLIYHHEDQTNDH